MIYRALGYHILQALASFRLSCKIAIIQAHLIARPFPRFRQPLRAVSPGKKLTLGREASRASMPLPCR